MEPTNSPEAQPDAARPNAARPNAARPKRRSWLQRWAPWILYAGLVAAIAGGVLAMLMRLPPDDVLKAQAWLRKASHVGTLVQLVLCIWIVACWQRLVAWGRARHIVSKAEHRAVLALRFRVAVALAIYLLLIPIGMADIARLFFGLAL